MARPFVDLKVVRTLSDTISIVFESTFAGLPSLLRCLLVIAGPALAVALVTGGYSFSQLALVGDFFDSSGPFSTGVEQTISTAIALLLFYGSVAIALTLILAVMAGHQKYSQDHNQYPPSYKDILPHVKKAAIRFVGYLFVFAMFFGASVFLIALLISVGGVGQMAGVGLVVVLLFAFVWIVIPLQMSTMSYLLEPELSLVASLRRGFTLVDGYWWFTFGLLFLINLIGSLLSLLFFIPLQFISLAGSLSLEGSDSAITQIGVVLSAISVMLGYVVSTILQAHALIVVFYNHKERVDNTSLMSKIESIR